MDENYQVNFEDILINVRRVEEYGFVKSFCSELTQKATYTIDFKKKYLIYECKYSEYIHKICFLLERKCQILECKDYKNNLLNLKRNKDIIIIDNKMPFNSLILVYSFQNLFEIEKTDFLINTNSGILIDSICPSMKKQINIYIKQKKRSICNVLSGNKPSDIYIYYYSLYNFYCIIGNNKINIKCNRYGFDEGYLVKLLFEFIEFYKYLFNKDMSVIIMNSTIIKSEALSLKGLVLINNRLCEKSSLLFHRYLIHELLHQQIGLKIKFINFGSEWLKESLTEYIQFLFFERRFCTNISIKMLKYYKKMYFAYMKFDTISISDTYIGMPIEQYNAVVCAKGFFVLRTLLMYFEEDEILVVKKILQGLEKKRNRITIQDFFSIVSKLANKDFTVFYNNWIKQSGVPILNIRWKYLKNRIQIQIYQYNLIYNLKLKIVLVYELRKEVFNCLIDEKEINFEIEVEIEPKCIEIDPCSQILFLCLNMEGNYESSDIMSDK